MVPHFSAQSDTNGLGRPFLKSCLILRGLVPRGPTTPAPPLSIDVFPLFLVFHCCYYDNWCSGFCRLSVAVCFDSPLVGRCYTICSAIVSVRR